MISCTDPTRRARSTLWTASYSSATWPSFSEWTARVTSRSRARRRAFSWPEAAATSASSSFTRGSAAARFSTSRENTTAAAGAPPMTEA